ncbi:hypothetical protein R3P38DRAFT_3353754 [Favolaschia claudopus]|uniref:Uncharacterized protein n=1 Tax=Favolaschia claudopus TaxID=2862362 RepID=A0AAW0BUB6_9AGAR
MAGTVAFQTGMTVIALPASLAAIAVEVAADFRGRRGTRDDSDTSVGKELLGLRAPSVLGGVDTGCLPSAALFVPVVAVIDTSFGASVWPDISLITATGGITATAFWAGRAFVRFGGGVVSVKLLQVRDKEFRLVGDLELLAGGDEMSGERRDGEDTGDTAINILLNQFLERGDVLRLEFGRWCDTISHSQ